MGAALPALRWRPRTSPQGGEDGGWSGQGHHLDVGVLDQAELLLDLVELFLLPPDVGLQNPRPLLQLVFDGLEHAELC